MQGLEQQIAKYEYYFQQYDEYFQQTHTTIASSTSQIHQLNEQINELQSVNSTLLTKNEMLEQNVSTLSAENKQYQQVYERQGQIIKELKSSLNRPVDSTYIAPSRVDEIVSHNNHLTVEESVKNTYYSNTDTKNFPSLLENLYQKGMYVDIVTKLASPENKTDLIEKLELLIINIVEDPKMCHAFRSTIVLKEYIAQKSRTNPYGSAPLKCMEGTNSDKEKIQRYLVQLHNSEKVKILGVSYI